MSFMAGFEKKASRRIVVPAVGCGTAKIAGAALTARMKKTAQPEKKKERLPKKPSRADAAERIEAGGQLATLGGQLGAMLGQKWLGRRLDQQHTSMPWFSRGSNIADLQTHVKDVLDEVQEHVDLPAATSAHSSFLRNSAPTPEMKKNLGEIAELGESFMKGFKLRESGVKVNIGTSRGGKLSDYYNPIKNTVNIATASPAVALHEMGHAADYRGSVAKMLGRYLPHAAALGAVPVALAYGDAIKDKIPGTLDDKIISFLQEHPVATGLAGYTSATLYPEAKATFLAMKHLGKVRGRQPVIDAMKKTLGPAYGTYLLGALPLAAGFHVSKKIRDREEAQYQKDKKRYERAKEKLQGGGQTKAAALSSSARKAFWTGFAGAAIPSAAATGYLYGTEGGKVLRETKRPRAEAQIRDMAWTRAGGERNVESYRKGEKWRESHPIVTAGLAAASMGLLSGVATAISMEQMGIKKLVK